MLQDIYYLIELKDLDGLISSILVKDSDLGSIINNYDKNGYILTNVYGLGQISLDYKEFIAKDENLEKGKE